MARRKRLTSIEIEWRKANRKRKTVKPKVIKAVSIDDEININRQQIERLTNG